MKKRIIPLFKMESTGEEAFKYVKEHPQIQDAVISETVFAIKEGMQKNKKSVGLFEIHESNMILELDNSQWELSLNHALNFYIKKEEYIKCAEIRDLIKKLKINGKK